MVRQKENGRPVRFELSEQTRQAADDYLRGTGKRAGVLSLAVAAKTAAQQRGSMPVSCRSGSEASGWTPGSLGRVQCNEQKRP